MGNQQNKNQESYVNSNNDKFTTFQFDNTIGLEKGLIAICTKSGKEEQNQTDDCISKYTKERLEELQRERSQRNREITYFMITAAGTNQSFSTTFSTTFPPAGAGQSFFTSFHNSLQEWTGLPTLGILLNSLTPEQERNIRIMERQIQNAMIRRSKVNIPKYPAENNRQMTRRNKVHNHTHNTPVLKKCKKPHR